MRLAAALSGLLLAAACQPSTETTVKLRSAPVTLTVYGDGKISLDGQQVLPKELPAELKNLETPQREQRVGAMRIWINRETGQISGETTDGKALTEAELRSMPEVAEMLAAHEKEKGGKP